MRHSPLRRALALLLSCSPLLWVPDVVLAQSIQRLGDPRSARPGAEPYVQPGQQQGQEQQDAFSGPRLPEGEQLHAKQGPPTPAAPPPPTAAVALDEPLDPGHYVCGPGDVLELNFWGLQNSRVRVTIDLEGRAFIPRIGYLGLLGKTLTEARAAIRQAVTRNYPKLSFDVTLAVPRTFLVHVAAGVNAPGAYPVRATDRVSSIVALAGGPGPRGSRRRVEIRRTDGTVLQADLARYALDGDVRHNPRLLEGDVVRVPFEEVAATIDGAVNRPGRYELIGTRDLAELVDVAGGLAPTATKQLNITLLRRMPDDRQAQEALAFGEGGALPAVKLQHDDVVRVPDYLDQQRLVTVVGAVKGVAPPTVLGTTPEDPAASRRLPYVEGDTVRTLLDRVGGPGPLADLAGAYLVREGKQLPVDLQALLMLRDLTADRPVQLGDTLVVPFKRRNVLVKGAVFTPGPYPHDPAFGVEQYVALAGGRSRFAKSLSSARVITPDGETQKFERDLVIPPGSSVVVPERDFSPTEIVQILISAASVVVSGVAVVLAARR